MSDATPAAPGPAWPQPSDANALRGSLRVLRALAWLRWRMLVNTLNLSGRRDTLERFSRTLETLGPILIALLTIPALIGMAVLGTFAGSTIVGGTEAGPAAAAETALLAPLWLGVRFVLIALLLAAASMPFIAPGGRDLAGVRRLLLLPIPRGMLYLTETVSALADPWTALLVPLVFGVAAGVAWSAGVLAALAALLGAFAFLTVVTGVVSLFATMLHLVAKNRRRAELVAVVAMLVLPMIGVIPSMMAARSDGSRRRAARQTAARQAPQPPRPWPAWTHAVPTELYTRSVAEAANRQPAAAAVPLAALALLGGGLHGLAWLLFRRLYDSPSTTSSAASASAGEVHISAIPGLSSAASAVAMAMVRLVTRSPRGRTCLVGPLLMLLVFGGLVLTRTGDSGLVGMVRTGGGLGLAMVIAFFSLLALHPVLVNQFAIDGAGLTLEFLQPVSDRDLLRGKMVGGALVSLGPIVIVLVLTFIVFGGGTWGQWLALVLGIVATYAAIAPVAAAMSVLFPRAVNFNSMGRSSNPNQIASIVTALATIVAAAIPFALTAGTAVGNRPNLAFPLVGVWTAIAVCTGWWLLRATETTLHSRRENLVLVAGGR